MVFALGGTVPPEATVAALLAYRAIYFVLPLLLSGALIAAFEVRAIAIRLAPRGFIVPSPRVAQLVPMFLGVISFAIGVMLLVSGATPAFGHRLAILATTLPLWVVESFASARQRAGRPAAVRRARPAAPAGRRLVAGHDDRGRQSGPVAGQGAGVHRSRRAGLPDPAVGGDAPPLRSSGVAVPGALHADLAGVDRHCADGGVLGAVLCLPRCAVQPRAVVAVRIRREGVARAARHPGASLFAGALALWQLLRPASGRLTPPTPDDLRLAALIVRAQERSDAVLAMMGDKSFVFSPSRRAFLMYAKRGRSWVALYDPVGPREEWPALIARFVALAHAHAGRAAFYQVRPEALPLYLDAGLKLMKLGEEACIDLETFGLEGPQRANLRYALKRGERDGLDCRSHRSRGGPWPCCRSLREVSDAWLKAGMRARRAFRSRRSMPIILPRSL